MSQSAVSFGGDGTVVTHFGGGDIPGAPAVQPGGKLVTTVRGHHRFRPDHPEVRLMPAMGPDHWNQRYEQSERIWGAEANRTLVSEVRTMVPGRALDLGCGEGRNAVWLATQGWTVTGVDFSEVGLDKARRLAEAERATVEWELADLRTYTPAPDAYDLVVVLYLHLPVEERRSVHAAAAAALGVGGAILVLGHDESNLTNGYGGPQDPSLLFTPEDVVEDLAGLSVAKAERVVRRVWTDAGERSAIDALVRAVRS